MEDTMDKEKELARIFGMRFREERRRKGVTQAEVAKQFNITRNLISAWENGERLPNVKYWLKIVDYFQVSFAYLANSTDVRTEGRYSMLSEEEQSKLNAQGRKQLRNYYEFLMNSIEYTCE